MGSIRTCNGCNYISFPLRMGIPATELKGKYEKLKDCFSFLISSLSFNQRIANPSFEDEARLSGRIDEDLNSVEMKVNNIVYKLESVQLTYPTHSDWIPKTSNTNIQNKLDIIITLYNINEQDPKYILYIIPLIVDNSVTADNLYLQGLAYLSQTNLYSLESIFKGVPEKDYVSYETCVGQGDNIFICFNYTGIKISRNLYNSLLALWTNQDLTTIQKRIQEDIKKTKQKVQETLNNIRLNTSSEQALTQIDNLAGQLRDPSVINGAIDIWPTYVAPFMNQNTLPSTLVKEIECTSFQKNCPSSTIEAFSNMEGFTTGPPAPAPPAPAPPSSSIPIGDIKCVPLDIDGAITSDNKIDFDIDGNIRLGDIQSKREALRNSADVSKINYEQLRIIGGAGLGILIALLVIFFLVKLVFGSFLNWDIGPVTQGGFYFTIAGIFGFSGFLIGAALVK